AGLALDTMPEGLGVKGIAPFHVLVRQRVDACGHLDRVACPSVKRTFHIENGASREIEVEHPGRSTLETHHLGLCGGRGEQRTEANQSEERATDPVSHDHSVDPPTRLIAPPRPAACDATPLQG